MHRTLCVGLFVVGVAGAVGTTGAVAQGPNSARWDNAFHAALKQIEHVRDELQRVPDDRGSTNPSANDRWANDYLGHRARAIDHLNRAMQELQQAAPHDGRHENHDKADKSGKADKADTDKAGKKEKK